MRFFLAFFITSTVLVLSACTTPASNNVQSERVYIPFANKGGIENWHAVSDTEILIEGRNQKWYRATLMRRCFNLGNASTRTINFITAATGSFDKHGEIEVDGQRCRVKELERWINPEEMKKQSEGGHVS